MAKSFKSKRVKFPQNAQREFILHSKKKLDLTWNEFAKILGVSARQVMDWKNEKFSMPLNAVKIICRKTQSKLPKSIKILDAYWYVTKGARSGGLAVYQKYGSIGGDSEKRKKKWREWWRKRGQFKKNSIFNKPLSIKKPCKSAELAEFVGIVMGDGGISKYQLTITLNFKDDKEYIKFVVKLIKKLFNVKPSIYHNPKDSVDDIVVSRIELIKFCMEKLGLKKGNKMKQQIDIPEWIKNNKKFQTACVRGLVDTDGSVFTHRYKVNGKMYNYKKMAFTSRSKPLVSSVYDIFKSIGLNPNIAQKGRDVRIDSVEGVKKYFQIIGTDNPKHLRRYKR